MNFVCIAAANFGSKEDCQQLVDRVNSTTKYRAIVKKTVGLKNSYYVVFTPIAIADAGEFFKAMGADPKTDWIEWSVQTAD